MSRNLPARPNLEFLKNEAKARLDDLRRTDPNAQLTDAQHALSIEYGFASWPKLKTHVDALAAIAIESPLAGSWIADVSRSKRHPANPFKSARIHVAVRGHSVDIRDEFVDESGRSVRGHNRVEADGVERVTANGYAITASWLGDRELETVTRQGDQLIVRATYAVSADGRTLTITDHSGDSLVILDRLIQ
jgi:hypothetical protein